MYNSDCLRRVANWSKIAPSHKFDKKTFKPDEIVEHLNELSPKMVALLDNIRELDAEDMSKYGKHFKHFIFSDVKQGGYGSKVITSAMIASGFTLGYDNKMRMLSDAQLLRTKGKNVVLMSSTAVFDDAMKVATKKDIFAKYNSRPDNVNGDLIRFIVMDSGFKEGIDLFDIKYVHVFEPQTSKADMKQVVGRGTRTCGQKGLEFHPTQGWPLKVFLYDVSLPKDAVSKLGGQDTLFKMYIESKGIDVRKMRLADELERYSIIGSVDYELNKNIHNFELEDDTDYFNLIFDGGAGTRVRVKPTEVKCEGKCGMVRQTRDVPLGTAVLAVAYFALKKELPKKEKKPRAFFCGELKSDPRFCKAAKEIYVDPISFVKRYAEEIIKAIERKRHLMLPPHVRVSMFRFVFGIIPKPMKLKPLIDEEVAPNGPIRPSPSPSPEKKSPSPRPTPSPEKTESPVIPKTPEQITYDYKQTFLGVREYIRENFTHLAWPKVKLENMCGGPNMNVEKYKSKQSGGTQLMNLTPTQEFVSTFYTPQSPQKGMLLWHSVGTGKCWAKDTPILMFDGSIKMVQDVKVGDIVMGDDSTPRTVLSLGRGRDDMYDIIDEIGEKYRVNSEHILCLKPARMTVRKLASQKTHPYSARYVNTNTRQIECRSHKTIEEANAFLCGVHAADNVMEIEVKDFLKLPKRVQYHMQGYRVGVDFPSQPVLFDPYTIGYWLGSNGTSNILKNEIHQHVAKYMRAVCAKHGLPDDFMHVASGNNRFQATLRTYGLRNHFYIPSALKVNDRTVRMHVLAGIIDASGHVSKKGDGYTLVQKNKALAHDIVYVARSLGFVARSSISKNHAQAGVLYRVYISGTALHDNEVYTVPVKIPEKRIEFAGSFKKHPLMTGISIKHVGKGEYYGFTLDGNNRLLMGDFTVTHNTCAAIATASSTFEKQGYTILWVTRTTLKSDIWKNMFDQVCSAAIKDAFAKDPNFKMPSDMSARMGLLSKSWSIRPMSYKQFSNLVSGSNEMYKQLVKKNGAADPLRKTLLIIDEAHKLYGGTDLSSVERPDMNKLHAAIMKSYRVSGEDSVRLLLMTATPFTNDPLELIKLINLCRTSSNQIPDEFDGFAKKYLTEDGSFTKRGSRLYLDDIAGHISYLNREKDARQFSQPIITPITVEASAPQDGKTSDEIKEEYEVMLVDLTEQLKSAKEELSTKRKEVMKAKKDQRDTCKDLKKQERVNCMERVAIAIKHLEEDFELSKQEHDAIAADLKVEMKNVRDAKKSALKAAENNVSQMSILTNKCMQSKSKSKSKKNASPNTNSSP